MRKRKILIIDDEKDFCFIMKKDLERTGNFDVLISTEAKKSIVLAKKEAPDLILLDILMPEIDGMEIKKSLNSAIKTAGIPVIFLTAIDATSGKVQGLSLGADDYITKPFELEELLARINSALNRRGFYEDLFMKDGLTGLRNIHFFNKQLSIFFNMAKFYKQIFSLALIDINYLKIINDTYGHAAGDFVLKKLSELMQKVLRKVDIITRYGGDEFVIILPGCGEEGAATVMKKLQDKIKESEFVYENTGEKLSFSVSIGFAAYHGDIDKENELFELADANMYKNKKAKKDSKIT